MAGEPIDISAEDFYAKFPQIAPSIPSFGSSNILIQPQARTPKVDLRSPAEDVTNLRDFIATDVNSAIVESAKGGLRGISSGMGFLADALANIGTKMSPIKPQQGAELPRVEDLLRSGLSLLAGDSIEANPQNTAERYLGAISEGAAGSVLPGGKLKDAALAGSLFGFGKEAGSDLGTNPTATGIGMALIPTGYQGVKGLVSNLSKLLEGQAPKLEASSYGITKADFKASPSIVGPDAEVKLSKALKTAKESGSLGGITDVAADRAIKSRDNIKALEREIDDLVKTLDARKGAMRIKPKAYPKVDQLLDAQTPTEKKRLLPIVEQIKADNAEALNGSFASLNNLKRKFWSAAYNEGDKVINDLNQAFGSDLRQLIEDKANKIGIKEGFGSKIKATNEKLGEEITVQKLLEREAKKGLGGDFYKDILPRLATTGGSIVGPTMAFAQLGNAPLGTLLGTLFAAGNTPIGRRATASAIRWGSSLKPQSVLDALRTQYPTIVQASND